MLNHRTRRLEQPNPQTTYVEEQGWLARVRAGDHNAFRALYDQYADSMFAFAYSSLKSHEEAQDVIQDVFLSIWKNREGWELSTSMRSYLMRAVFNRVATLRRHLRVELTAHETTLRPIDLTSEWAYRTSADANLDERELATALEHAVNTLSPRAQQAFRLIREQHLTYAEAAHVLGVTTHTLEQHLIKALKALRTHLADWRTPRN